MKKNLLYFCNGIGSVFDSQVLELLNSVAEKSVFEKIALCLGIRNDAEKDLLQKKNLNPGIDIISYRSYPNYPFYNKLIQKEIKKALSSFDGDLDKSIIHTRGELLAFHILQVLPEAKKFLIADVRGASIEEVEEYFNIKRLQKILKVYNYKKALRSLQNVARVVSVSNSLKNYLMKLTSIHSKAITIIPGLAGRKFYFDTELRERKRKELNIEKDELLIVFSTGGDANWQNMNLIQYLANKHYKILNLSKKIIDKPNVINRFVPYKEMPVYLNASDIGIIWRDKSVVNEVASPIKFSEYVCCGLPVIANKTVDSIKEYISRFASGKLVEKFEDLSDKDFKYLVQQDRVKNSQIGRSIFSTDVVVEKYLKVYETI